MDVTATVTIRQGLALDPPPWLALMLVSAVIKNASGGPVSAAWVLRAQTAAGLRSLSGPDLSAVPGTAIITPITPLTLAAGSSSLFSVTCLAQFPTSLSGALFTFAPDAIQTVSQVLVQVLNYAFRASVNYPVGPGDPLPELDPTNSNVLIPPAAPTSYSIPLLDWF